MFKRIISIIVILAILNFATGCATYQFGQLPSPYIGDHPNVITQKGVSVAVKFLSGVEAETIFDCATTKKKVEPVFIVIENKSDETYHFRKVFVDASYIPAEEVAKKCARPTMMKAVSTSLPLIGLLALPMLLLIIGWASIAIFTGGPPLAWELMNRSKMNRAMRQDYLASEIADTVIVPQRAIRGVIFVAPLGSGTEFNIPLFAQDSAEILVFSFNR